MPAYDVFLSYRRADLEPVRELAAALERRGLRVWRDETAIGDFAGATEAARDGIAASRAFVAYYSAAYPLSRPCQWELTEAFVAAQRLGDPVRRVLVVNPEPGFGHIEPVQLRDANAGGGADAIAAHVAGLEGVLGDGTSRVRWLPSPVASAPRFVGRLADMWRIHSALSAPDLGMTQAATGPGVAVLRGIGGAGKSLLAQEYALRFAAAYPGGVFWLRASPDEIERQAQVRELARLLLGPGRAHELEGAAPELLDALLREEVERGERCLWIVDDLPGGLEPETVARWLGPEPARTLITTRSGEYGGFAEVALGMLGPDEALALLTARRAPEDDGERAAAREVVEDLGCHALAIDVAAATARFQGYAELRDGLRDLSADELELAAKLRDRLPTGHERSVAATLNRSIRGLGDGALDVLRLAAELAALPIPADLVGDVLAAADELDERAARWTRVQALDELASVSLAELAGEEAWTVHELVSRTILAGGEGASRREELRAAAAGVIGDRILRAPGVQSQLIDLATHAQLAPVLPHARHLSRDADDAETVRLLGFVAIYDQFSGALESAEALWQRELEANRRLYGEDDARTLRSITFLAEVLGARGRQEDSLELHRHALAAFERQFGRDDPRVLAQLNLIAGALYRLGRHGEAIELFRQAVEARERVLGATHRDTLDSKERLAELLAQQGRFDEARELAEAVVEGRTRAVGPDHTDTLESLSTLARIVHRAGDAVSGALLQHAAEAGRIEALGEDHLVALDGMHDRAMALLDAGELDEALRLNAHVLERRRELLGPEAPKTLSSATNLAEALRLRGELDAARALIEDTWPRSVRVLGEDHPDTQVLKNNLAAVLTGLGDYATAARLFEEVLASRERSLGGDHPTTLQTRGSLTALYIHLGDIPRAIAIGERAVLDAKRVLGPRHPITVAAFNTLAAALGRSGDGATVRAVIMRVAPYGPDEFLGP